jgi:phage shock protein C
MKKLYKSREDKVFSGVLGGLGKYFGIDPVILRVAWITLTVFSGFFLGISVYILSALVIPREPLSNN